MSANAFHEKAGRCQEQFLFRPYFPGAGRLCRHPSIRTLLMSDFSLGASWAFSFQSVLPPDFRPRLRLPNGGLGQAFVAVTGTRRS